MPNGFVYILECSDGTFYTGSTIDLDNRLQQHNNGEGANHTKKRLSVNLVYVEEFQRIDEAFLREKQIQGWSRKKKLALIEGNFIKLKEYAECKNSSHYKEQLRLRSATKTNPDNENKPISKPKIVTKKHPYHSNGKLLLTGEYVVLDGALSLAVPTKFGQSLEVEAIDDPQIIWKSLDENGTVWYEDEFKIDEINTSLSASNDVSKRLVQILNAAKTLNPEFLNLHTGYKITTILDFPRHWGLGTSSTLINNLAQWAGVDAYQLLENTFGGSGYDIACAKNNQSITYQLVNGKPVVNQVDFNPSFKKHLYFVYLNQKQNSREGIKHYHANKGNSTVLITDLNRITKKMLSVENLEDFEVLLYSHENIISKITNQTTVKRLLFNDFEGAIKSLGAWGGDFVLVTSKSNPTNYFKEKGFDTVIPYADMVL